MYPACIPHVSHMYLACNQHVSNMYLDYGNDYLSKDTCILHVTRMSLAFQIRLSLEAFLRYMYLIIVILYLGVKSSS